MTTWRRASLCQSGECVEVGADWRKSSHSGANGNCVEAAFTKSSHSGAVNCVEAAFAKSGYSGAQNCVEAAGPFTKSSHSESGNCVEQAGCACGVDVLVRDSKNPDGGVLEFSRDAWMAFLADIKAGAYK